jgi:N-acetylmuramoyl-L-alanine amidase
MKFTVCAGHGGTDPGAVYNGFTERDMMLELRHLVSYKLKTLEQTVVNDGDRWTNLPLAQALPLVKDSDLAIELHLNAGPVMAKGVEAFSLRHLKTASSNVAVAVAEVLKTTVRGDKGWKPQEESARKKLAFVNAGGIILETFFMTNSQEFWRYQETKWLVAGAIAEALITSAKSNVPV